MEVSESIIRSLAQASIPLKSTSSPFIDILIIVVLIFINAFFSASEIAVISLNDNVVRRQAEEGDRLARRLIRLIDNPSGFLATIQVGVTLAGFLSSAFAADKFASRLYALLDPTGSFPSIYTVSVVAVTLILAFSAFDSGQSWCPSGSHRATRKDGTVHRGGIIVGRRGPEAVYPAADLYHPTWCSSWSASIPKRTNDRSPRRKSASWSMSDGKAVPSTQRKRK